MARHHIRWNAACPPAMAGGTAVRPFNLAGWEPHGSLEPVVARALSRAV